MIRSVYFIVYFLLISFVNAADDPRAVYSAYWAEFTCGRFMEAASFVHPQDLSELRNGILPLLAEARSSRSPGAAQIASKFFSSNPKVAPNGFDERHVFAGLSYVAGFAETVEPLCGTKLVDFQLSPSGSGGTTLNYSVLIGDSVVKADEPVELDQYQGRVYIRTPTKPAETIQGFKKALGR